MYCGGGGAGMGYAQAGFDVLGVDIEPQADYPFRFLQADALEPPVDLADFDLIHASPPCQAYSTMAQRWENRAPSLIGATRVMLAGSGVPFIIENVLGALGHMRNPITLTGEMFGLGVHRARLFELGGWWTLAPAKPPRQENAAAVYGRDDGRRIWTRSDGSELRVADTETAREAMGIDWLPWETLKEAVPPAYTRYLGEAFLAAQGMLPVSV